MALGVDQSEEQERPVLEYHSGRLKFAGSTCKPCKLEPTGVIEGSERRWRVRKEEGGEEAARREGERGGERHHHRGGSVGTDVENGAGNSLTLGQRCHHRGGKEEK